MWKRRSFNLARSFTERKQTQRLNESKKIRLSSWMKLLISTIPSIIFGVFTVVFTLQQNSSSHATREQDKRYADAQSKRAIFDNYIDVISERLLNPQFNRSNYEHLQTIRIKTLTAFRQLDGDYKKEIILFLYENNLIRSTLPIEKRLDLDGADFGDIQFRRSTRDRCILNDLYLSGVFASNILFDGCELARAIFDRSILNQSQFINCILTNSTFIESLLHQTNFDHTDLDGTNFTGALLTKTIFFTVIFRLIDFTNADLFQSDLTDTDLRLFFNTTKANTYVNTRFPNGSFSYIESKQLIEDGGAELECSENRSSYWFNYRDASKWHWQGKKKGSVFSNLPEPVTGRCYFFTNNNSQNYQYLDVKRYSTLVKRGFGWCNFSAYMGCSENHSNSNVYIDLRFLNERNISNITFSSNTSSHKKGFHFETMTAFIPPDTRKISARIGATINETIINNIPQYCVMDEITAFIFFKETKNIP